MIKPVAAVLSCLALTVPAHADTLYFTLQGLNPDGKTTYGGTVALTEVANGAHGEKSGIVTWVVAGGAPIRGIIMSSQDKPGRLSISFPNTPIPGVALGQFAENGSVRVRWYIGGESAGSEIWTRRR